MTEPPFPEAITGRIWGTVPGLCRRLNKRSFARGCLKQDSLQPDEHLHTAFIHAERYASLAFGTAPGAGLTGEVLTYDAAAHTKVITELNRREGWDETQPITSCGYLQAQVRVHTEQGVRPCITYLSNPDGIHHVEGLDPHDIIHILRRATPKGLSTRACGVYYVSTVAQWLCDAGRPDADMHSLLETMGWLETQQP